MANAMQHTLDKELQVFEEKLPEMLEHDGKYALVSGNEFSVFEAYEDALKIGYERYGLKPFLVKKISSVDTIQYFTRDLAH